MGRDVDGGAGFAERLAGVSQGCGGAWGLAGAGRGLLITVFTLPGVFLTPVAGVLSDKFGRKTVLIPSLLLFGVAGGACALARDFELLLGLRVLQGVGAATLGATNVP
jgi:MFS transporter, ACDE family, multidrug resistance protein